MLLTLPSQNSTVWVDPEGNVGYQCEPSGEPLTDLESLRVYVWPVSGGQARVQRTYYVRGLEGQEFPIDVEPGPGIHVWVTVLDRSHNESCASNVVYVPGTVTAAEGGATPPRIVKAELFDVHGRRLRGPPKASGVYYERLRYSDGRMVRRKIVLIR